MKPLKVSEQKKQIRKNLIEDALSILASCNDGDKSIFSGVMNSLVDQLDRADKIAELEELAFAWKEEHGSTGVTDLLTVRNFINNVRSKFRPDFMLDFVADVPRSKITLNARSAALFACLKRSDDYEISKFDSKSVRFLVDSYVLTGLSRWYPSCDPSHGFYQDFANTGMKIAGILVRHFQLACCMSSDEVADLIASSLKHPKRNNSFMMALGSIASPNEVIPPKTQEYLDDIIRKVKLLAE